MTAAPATADRQAPTRGHTGTLASVGLVVMWSSGFVGAELVARAGAGPLTVLAWRFLLLAVLLLTVCAVTKTSLRSLAAWRRQLPLGLLCQAVYLVLVFEGVSRGVHGGTTALIAALQPLLVATVAGRLLGERTNRLMWVGMAVGLAGVVVVVSGDLGTHGAPLAAYALPLLGMLSLTTGTVLTRRLRPTESILQSITMQSVITAVATMAVAALAGQAAPPDSGGAWVAVGWLIVLSSLGGYGLYVFVTRTLGATTVSTLLYLTPPTTMLWVWLMFGEPVTAVGVAGLVVSAVGVGLVLRGQRRGTRHAADSEPASATP